MTCQDAFLEGSLTVDSSEAAYWVLEWPQLSKPTIKIVIFRKCLLDFDVIYPAFEYAYFPTI